MILNFPAFLRICLHFESTADNIHWPAQLNRNDKSILKLALFEWFSMTCFRNLGRNSLRHTQTKNNVGVIDYGNWPTLIFAYSSFINSKTKAFTKVATKSWVMHYLIVFKMYLNVWNERWFNRVLCEWCYYSGGPNKDIGRGFQQRKLRPICYIL